MLKRYGGFVEGQYYFSNQWFLNGVYAVSKAYGVSRARAYMALTASFNGINGMEWAMAIMPQTIQQAAMTLWYRPIQAIKFGLQYEYTATTYYQYLDPHGCPLGSVGTNPANNVNRSNFGDDHRVEFVGFFYF